MKAEIISFVALVVGRGCRLTGLLVEEKNNLMIVPFQEAVTAYHDFKKDGACTSLGEIDISEELVKKALILASTQSSIKEDEEYERILEKIGKN